MPITCRRTYVTAVIASMMALALLTAAEVFGQFTSLHAPDRSVRGDRVNLFAAWSGEERADGFLLELPDGWSLDSVTVVRGGYRRAPATVSRADGFGYRIEMSEEVQGPHDLVFHLVPDDVFAQDRVVLTPLRRSGRDYEPRIALRVERRLRVVDGAVERTNRVVTFASRRSHPLVFRHAATPDLSADRTFVISLWMKTAALREVVLSTWNGEDRRAYPVEMTVDASGRLRVFRGRPGEHRSLASQRPVADGAWHHVELSNDPEGGWTRLVVDGSPVDSLYAAVPPRSNMELPLVLGGRSDGPAPYFDGLAPFSGSIDDLEVAAASGMAFLLDFQDAVPAELFDTEARLQYEYDDPRTRHQVEAFEAISGPEGVALSWTSYGTGTRAFVVERSYDGRTFESIERVLPDRSATYRVLDAQIDNQLVFYRIRQHFEDGSERITGTLRVGLGAEASSPVILLGNFPNPFNATTTVSYQVREASPVHLGVWDLSGNLVALLVDRIQQPGVYDARFDASDLPSGTYFVRLRTPRGTFSHKMILMK